MSGRKKVVVFCPGGAISGGPELLHQLVHELRKNGADASISYYPFENSYDTPNEYLAYDAPNKPFTDTEHQIVVIPEVATYTLRAVKKSEPVIWWLSVDNYSWKKGDSKLRDAVSAALSLVKGHRVPFYKLRKLKHLTQSHYAMDYLRRKGVASEMLTDYLNSDHLTPRQGGERENLIAFNPKKGRKVTSLLRERYPDLRFVPIQNMTRNEVADFLGTAKVFIDFGNHPGKDRLPREAAMAGCCVVTGLKGSAAFAEDVPIPRECKLDENRADFPEKWRLTIDRIFNDFDQWSRSYDDYRARIRQEPNDFHAQVVTIFRGLLVL